MCIGPHRRRYFLFFFVVGNQIVKIHQLLFLFFWSCLGRGGRGVHFLFLKKHNEIRGEMIFRPIKPRATLQAGHKPSHLLCTDVGHTSCIFFSFSFKKEEYEQIQLVRSINPGPRVRWLGARSRPPQLRSPGIFLKNKNFFFFPFH